jgi:hypothetical protein
MFRRSSVFFATVAALSSVSACSNSTSPGGNSSSVAGGVQSIIFVQRMFTTTTNGVASVDVAGGNGQVLDYDRYVPGGQLNLLTPPSADGKLQNITAAYPTADFNGADLSFDATQVVFSMKRDANDTYHIYVATLPTDGSDNFDIHQKTEGMQDDVFPSFIAGGRIVFVTNEMYTAMGTRADEYEHARAATQLATISVDGGDADRRPFAQSLSHTVRPFPRSDGKIGYSRWEHLGGTNDVKIFAANPDGTNMIAVAGQHGKPCNSLYSIKETSTPNMMIGIGTDRDRTIQAGALIQIDARNQNDPVCLNASSDQTGHACLDEENAKITNLTPNVPLGSDPSPAGRYREPSVLPDGRILTSWADGPVNDQNEQTLTPPDFGIYIYDSSTGQNQLVFNDRTKWDLNAQAVVVRKTPPVIADLQTSMDGAEPVRIGSIDITQTSLVETEDGAQFSGTQLSDALKQAVGVRVIEGFSSESAKGVEKFGLTMHEGAAVLGTANIYGDGSWLANVPSYIPVHLQPIDKFGMSIRSQALWIQGEPGEDRRCIGCHESRTGQGVPALGANPTVAEQHGAQDFTEAIAARAEYPWDKNDNPSGEYIQQILTASCVSCHNNTTNGSGPQTFYTVGYTNPLTGQMISSMIPYLSFDTTPITVYYDKDVMAWPTSYVSIFYPSAMEMGTVTVMGTVPPMWGVPASARQSKLIEKINIKAPDGTYAWPLATHPLHPEDVGGSLSDDDRQSLVRAMDLGGQFYARQNTEFTPNTNDPVAVNSKVVPKHVGGLR